MFYPSSPPACSPPAAACADAATPCTRAESSRIESTRRNPWTRSACADTATSHASLAPYQLNRAHAQREHVRFLRRRRSHHLSTLHSSIQTQRRQIAAVPVPKSFVHHVRSQSEVGQFELPIGATALRFAPFADQNVVRFHVQMSEAALMEPAKRVADLPEQHGDVFLVERFLDPMEKGKKGNMLQILRDGPIETVFQLDEEEIVFLPRCEVSNDVRRLAWSVMQG